jgi:subtilisin family serine protease
MLVLILMGTISCGQNGGGSQKNAGYPAVPGEFIVRLRPGNSPCVGCASSQTTSAVSPSAVRRTLDDFRLRHRIRGMEPAFHLSGSGARKAQRQGFSKERTARIAQLSEELANVYVVRTDPQEVRSRVRDELLRDPSVVVAEPNYIYRGTAASASGQPVSSSRNGNGLPTEGSSDLPNDPYLNSRGSWGQPFSDLWGIFAIGAPAAWEVTQGEGVIVAVVDSGVDISHPDLRANVWRNADEIPGNGIDDDGNGFIDDVRGWDFTQCEQTNDDGSCAKPKTPSPNVSDRSGHGTHVAGIIAAVGDNGRGIIGVAPKATIMPVKALDSTGRGSTLALVGAILYAVDNGASVINASWAGPPSEFMRMVVDYASGLGVVVVAAAGNSAVPLRSGVSPAEIPAALAVGATTASDALANFSNFGGPLALVAPGGGDAEPQSDKDPRRSILSLLARQSAFGRQCHYEVPCESCVDVLRCARSDFLIGRRYVREAGTSMAAAFVSGVAALVRAHHPEFTREQVRQVLFESADDLGLPGWDRQFGSGRVNARRAVSIDNVPVADITAPTNGDKLQQWQFPFEIQGNALAPQGTLDHWQITIREADNQTVVLSAEGEKAIQESTLATIGPENVEAGKQYIVNLRVYDRAGNSAVDSKEFLVPHRRFALVPIPVPPGSGVAQELDSAGNRLLFTRTDQNGDTAAWLYDVSSNQRLRLGRGFTLRGWITGDGNVVSYQGALPDGTLCHGVSSEGQSAVAFHVNASSYECLLKGINATTAAVDHTGLRGVFISNERFNNSVDNPDGRWELFYFDQGAGTIDQLTRSPGGAFGDTELEIKGPAVSDDGSIVAFDAGVSLDPSRPFTPDRTRHVFVYNTEDGTTRRLTGGSMAAPDGSCVSLSRDGRTLAFRSSTGIYVGDPLTEHFRLVVDASAGPGCPKLAGNGRTLFFGSGADLDPTVGNEDGSGEVFGLDLQTQTIDQVTDTLSFPDCNPTIHNCGTDVSAVSDAGDVLAVDSVFNPQYISTPIMVLSPRVVLRQPNNTPPVLSVVQQVTLAVGMTTTINISAVDPDGDHVIFSAQRVPWSKYTLIERLAGYELTDHGDGTAEIAFTPKAGDEGKYRIQVAAFDDRGAVSTQIIRMVIQ